MRIASACDRLGHLRKFKLESAKYKVGSVENAA